MIYAIQHLEKSPKMIPINLLSMYKPTIFPQQLFSVFLTSPRLTQGVRSDQSALGRQALAIRLTSSSERLILTY